MLNNTIHEWHDAEGKLHRENDLPAYVDDYKQMWYLHGKLHRENDQPAIIQMDDGSKYWFQQGLRHRDNDQPASIEKIGPSEDMTWYQHGQKHRNENKPAVLFSDGSQQWWQNGVLIRRQKEPPHLLQIRKGIAHQARTFNPVDAYALFNMVDKINQLMQTVFDLPDNRYIITVVRENVYNVQIHDGKRNNCADVSVHINSDDNKNIAWVHQIDKCNRFRGTPMVQKIIEFSKELGLSAISLEDESHIETHGCELSLSIYYILIHGMSWYNKMGFKSIYYEKELENNSQLPQMTMTEFAKEMIVRNLVSTSMSDLTLDEIVIQTFYPKDKEPKLWFRNCFKPSTTIKQLVQLLVTYTKNKNICIFLNNLFDMFNTNFIRYSNLLTYDLSAQLSEPPSTIPLSGGKYNKHKTVKKVHRPCKISTRKYKSTLKRRKHYFLK